MTKTEIIGNAIALIAAIIMTASGYIKSKEKTLFWQTIQISLNTISCFVLGANSGGIVNMLSLPRNILAYKNKLVLQAKIIIWIQTVVLSLYFNSNGWIGYLPVISTTVYIFLMDKLKDIKFKELVIFTLIMWGTHDFFVRNYVSCFFDAACIITSSIAIYRIMKERKDGSCQSQECC